jgi:hypothetical protein
MRCVVAASMPFVAALWPVASSSSGRSLSRLDCPYAAQASIADLHELPRQAPVTSFGEALRSLSPEKRWRALVAPRDPYRGRLSGKGLTVALV